MRRVITAFFYALMIGVGVWLSWGFIVNGGRAVGLLAGGSLTLFGAYMFWLDFFSSDRLSKP